MANLSKICSNGRGPKKAEPAEGETKVRDAVTARRTGHVWSCTRVQQGCCCHCFTNSSASCLSAD